MFVSHTLMVRVSEHGETVSTNACSGAVQALDCTSPLVSREATRALGNLAANLEHGDSMLKEGALRSFMALIRSDDHAVQRMAAMALCNLSSNVRLARPARTTLVM